MSREIDDKKKRKALRKLRKAAERAEAEGGPGLSDWEKEFVEEVGTRVEKYGSAFADPDKGNLDEPLSALQTIKLKEIDKKSRGKGGFKRTGFKSTFKTKGKRPYKSRERDIHDDIEHNQPDEAPARPPLSKAIPPKGSKPKLMKASELRPGETKHTQQPAPGTSPIFKVIKGGKST